MSSACTQAGEPTGNRVLARDASRRAVLASPRATAAPAAAQSASAQSPASPYATARCSYPPATAVRGIARDLHAALEYSRLRAEVHAD